MKAAVIQVWLLIVQPVTSSQMAIPNLPSKVECDRLGKVLAATPINWRCEPYFIRGRK